MWVIPGHSQPRTGEEEVAVTFDDMLHEEDNMTTMAGFQKLVELCLQVAAGLHAIEGAAVSAMQNTPMAVRRLCLDFLALQPLAKLPQCRQPRTHCTEPLWECGELWRPLLVSSW